MIKDFNDGQSISDVFLIKDATKATTSTGLNFLTVVLEDSSGVIEAEKRDCSSEDLTLFVPGNVLLVSGQVLNYKGKLQFKILSAKQVDSKNVNLSSLILASPINFNVLVDKFKKIVNSVTNESLCKLLKAILNKYYDKLINYPAAAKNHHAFLHGLLHHTVSMCEVAEFVSAHYENVNRDLLISGCLLHDLGKVVELSGPVATKYTTEGNLLGHLTIGMSIVKETADEMGLNDESILLLEHMILSHHGKLEFGACVLPLTREALLLSMIDDMDAKMVMLDKAYENVKPGEYTERIFGLDNRSFYKAK